ncbi:MAG: YCF48-related protein [Methylobacter sp.]|nr:YCF48-related protein [Methylobacter sp.]
MSPAPRSPRKMVIALSLFLAVLISCLMQTNEYFVNGKGLDSDWLNLQTWLTPLSNHEALGQAGVNVGALNDVIFVDSQHGWAVGWDGVILVTDDGGQNWRQQQSRVNAVLEAVRFTDPQHGWALGEGVILATDNGGQSWRQQQSGVKAGLNAVQFTDPQHGWALSEYGIILATDNGGQSWRQQQSGVKTGLRAVQFTDPQHGWAVGWGGIILATDNGGQSWRQQQSGVITALDAVHFTDLQHGRAVGQDGVILATDNGGKSWQQQQSGVSTALNAVHFTNLQHGWAVGGDPMRNYGIILVTDNGGQSWHQQQRGVKARLYSVQFTDSQHGWAVGYDGIILATDNGGQDWHQQQNAVKTWWLNGVQFADSQHGWAVGYDGIILATDNGGGGWHQQQSGVKTILGAVQFIDQQHGWAVGDRGIILATDDGGQSWRQQQSGVNTMLYSVQFTDLQHGWAVGYDGIILATNNGGQSWHQQQSGVETRLVAVQFIDQQHGWVAGWNGILVTDNGGQSWRQQQSGVEARLVAVHFTDLQHGRAVGQDGIILATDNAGQSWHQQQSGVTTFLSAVQFVDSQHGWAAGENGVILVTDNGGVTWQNRAPNPKVFAEGRAKLAVFPSPLALLLLLLTGFSLFLHTYRYYAEPRRLQGGISDAPVTQAKEDCLGRLELVKTLANLIRNRDTVPPLAIAITAPWGSGKSSVLGLLEHELKGDVFTVQLNAWHYRDDGQLLAALMEHVREQALPPLLSWDNLLFRFHLVRLRCFAGSGFRSLIALSAGLTTTAFFAQQQQWQILGDWLNRELPALIPSWLQPSAAEPWFKLVLALLAALLVYRLLKSWLSVFSAFSPELVAVANRLSKSTREAMQVADWSKDAGLRFRFARDFETVAKALGKGRLLLLIDDLDRCEPKQIESVMTTLNFLFSTPAPCYAVLAMDWRYVTDALGLAFKDLAVARADTDTKGKAFAEHYLEKIIQISIDLPAVDGSRVALIDRTQRKTEEVIDWWDKLTSYWPWLSNAPGVFYPLSPILSLRQSGLERVSDLPRQRWRRFAIAVLQSPLRLLVSVGWRELEAGLWMGWQAIKRLNGKMLTPVSDGLLILWLATALAFAGVQLGLITQEFAARQLKPDAVESKATVIDPAKNAKPELEKKPVEAPESKAAAAPVVFVDEQRYPTYYGLWAFVGILSLMLLLMVWRLSLRLQDTQVFIEVMSQWQLWLAQHHDTPRDWKRLFNRARLFAMRVRVYRQKPWYEAFDEKWRAWRFQEYSPAQRDELDERLAMHLLMLDVYMKGELATIVWQFFKNKKDNDRFHRLIEALMTRSNDFPELKILMNHLERSYNEANDERSAEQEKAEAQLRLWFSLYAALNTLRL